MQSKVTDTINFLTKGCTCRKGCRTNQCGCRKKGNICGPGCQCQDCANTETTHTCTDNLSSESEGESESGEESGSEDSLNNPEESSEYIQTEIVTDIEEMMYSDLFN